MKTKEKIASGTPIGLAVTPEVNTLSIIVFLWVFFYKFNLLKISIIISMELPMNPLRLEATIGFMAGEPGSSLKIILF
jgi:hypothetical protein